MSLRCPRRMSAGAKQIWKRVVPAMEAAGLVVDADREALELYVATMADVEELEKLLVSEGRTVTTPNGMQMSSPCWTQLRQARQDANRFQTALGLNPKARKVLGFVGEEADDSDGDFK